MKNDLISKLFIDKVDAIQMEYLVQFKTLVQSLTSKSFFELPLVSFISMILGLLIAIGVAYCTIRAQYKNTHIQLKKSKYEEMFSTIQALLHHNQHTRSQKGYEEFMLYMSKIKMLQALYAPLSTTIYEYYIDSAGNLSASYMEDVNIEKNKAYHTPESISGDKAKHLAAFLAGTDLALDNIIHNSKHF